MKAKASFLEEKLKAEASMKTIKLREEVAVAEAKLQVYEQEEDSCDSLSTRSNIIEGMQTHLNTKCETWIKGHGNDNHTSLV